MPLNSIPATTTVEGLDAKTSAARGRCHVDVGFWGGVVPGNTSSLAPIASRGVLGFKCFMTPSGVDEFEPVGETDLRAAAPVLAGLSLPLLAHAEWPSLLAAADPTSDPRSYRTWLATRPPASEEAAIARLIELAREHRVHVHVVHLAAAGALDALRASRLERLPVTVETCPHYLTFSAEDIADGATAFGNRQAWHAITLDGAWRPGEDFGARDTAWTRRFFAALDRYREGVYVNFLGGDESPDRVREAYGDAVHRRLVDVKTTYDPDNVFHHNQNIRPRPTRISAQ